MKKISKVSENLKNSKTAEEKPKPRGGMRGAMARAASNIRAKTNLPPTRDTEEKPRRSLMQKIQGMAAKRLPRTARFEKGGSVNKRSKSSCK
jgi:hypothetical protein